MSEIPKIAYVTKYALTKGILEHEILSLPDDGSARVKLNGSRYTWDVIWRTDWFPTREAAIAHAEKMRISKITSLRKQLSKLEALSFNVVDQGGEG